MAIKNYNDSVDGNAIQTRQDLESHQKAIASDVSQFLQEANTSTGFAFASLLSRVYTVFMVDCQLSKAVGDKTWSERVDAYIVFAGKGKSADNGGLRDYINQLGQMTNYEGGQLMSTVPSNDGNYGGRDILIGFFMKHIILEQRLEDAEAVVSQFIDRAKATK